MKRKDSCGPHLYKLLEDDGTPGVSVQVGVQVLAVNKF